MNRYKRVSMLGQQCLYNASNEKRKDNVCAGGGSIFAIHAYCDTAYCVLVRVLRHEWHTVVIGCALLSACSVSLVVTLFFVRIIKLYVLCKVH